MHPASSPCGRDNAATAPSGQGRGRIVLLASAVPGAGTGGLATTEIIIPTLVMVFVSVVVAIGMAALVG